MIAFEHVALLASKSCHYLKHKKERRNVLRETYEIKSIEKPSGSLHHIRNCHVQIAIWTSEVWLNLIERSSAGGRRAKA